MPPDNWIYIQEPDVNIGRLQVFNNWSPAMVADPQMIWLGLEYFCREGDELWSMDDGEFIDFAAGELEKIGMIRSRMCSTGPWCACRRPIRPISANTASFGKVRAYLDQILESVSGRPQRHAPLQQSGSLDARGEQRGLRDARWRTRQNADLEHQRR
jgi:hypothetical protein